jgi:hypothetical protein
MGADISLYFISARLSLAPLVFGNRNEASACAARAITVHSVTDIFAGLDRTEVRPLISKGNSCSRDVWHINCLMKIL